MTGDSTAIADRIAIGAGPFAHCRRIPATAPATPRLRRHRLVGGLRRRATRTSSTTRSQPPTCSGELIEMRLAQVEFIPGRAVVNANRRHRLGAVTVKIAGKYDKCCLSHDTSVQRQTCNRLLARIQSRNDRSPERPWVRRHTARAASRHLVAQPTQAPPASAIPRHPTRPDTPWPASVRARVQDTSPTSTTRRPRATPPKRVDRCESSSRERLTPAGVAADRWSARSLEGPAFRAPRRTSVHPR